MTPPDETAARLQGHKPECGLVIYPKGIPIGGPGYGPYGLIEATCSCGLDVRTLRYPACGDACRTATWCNHHGQCLAETVPAPPHEALTPEEWNKVEGIFVLAEAHNIECTDLYARLRRLRPVVDTEPK